MAFAEYSRVAEMVYSHFSGGYRVQSSLSAKYRWEHKLHRILTEMHWSQGMLLY